MSINQESKPGTTGQSGNIVIQGNTLSLSQGAYLSVKSQGRGNAGSLKIETNQVRLNQGSIAASTRFGEGGNIAIDSNLVVMRNGSSIQTSASGAGNGGNLVMNVPVLVGLENSDIVANAFKGRGGNITITTQGIMGLKFRNTLTPRVDPTNDITASSALNVNGDVQIRQFGANPSSALALLPTDVVDSSQQMTDRCAAVQTSSFISTGRGGIPKNPMQTRKAGRTWSDLRKTESDRSTTTAVTTPIVQTPIVEASALTTNPDGSIELITPMLSSIDSGETCALQ